MRRTHHWKIRLLILAAMLLVIAALAGCRSRSQGSPAEAPAPTDTVAAPEAAAPAEEAAGESAVAEEPAAAEEPAVDAGATATAEAQLAAVSGSEEAAEAPTAEPPAEPAGEGETLALGACNHPYYPIRDGAVYRYLLTAPGIENTEMTVQYRVTGPDSFVTTQTYAGINTEAEWTCTEGGLLRTTLGLSGLDMAGMEYTVDNMSGMTFPPPEQFQVGETWQNTFSMSGEMAMEGLAITMSIEAVTDNVLAAFEPVTTPAGEFDAAKIDTATTIDINMDMGDLPAMPGMPGLTGMTLSTAMWLAEDVGMIKTVSEDPTGGTSVMELVAME